MVGQIWNRRFKDWDAPPYGEILGCASARLKGHNNKHNKGKIRLYQILISEAAYLIWTLRCTRVIKQNDESDKLTKKQKIINQLRKKLKMDCICIHTNESKFGRKTLRQKIVKKTWSGTLEDEDHLPQIGPREQGF